MGKYKQPLLFALCLVPIAAVAGIFVGLYQMELYPDLLAEAVATVSSTGAMLAIVAAQTALYALVCGFLGRLLAEKTGLWRPIRLERGKLLRTLLASTIGGVLLSLDYWTFGRVLPEVRTSLDAGMGLNGVLAAVLYGGIMEEVLMRLFFLSLIAFLLWKLFFRRCKKDEIPAGVFLAANVIAAFLFAAGHLPSTVGLFGVLTPLILFRCFLYNGGAGLLFGRLYRKYGITYAMVSHALFHIVSKLIWFVFI